MGRARMFREILFFLAIVLALLAIYYVATRSPRIPVYDVVPTCEGMQCREDRDCGSRCACIMEDSEEEFGRCRQKEKDR